MSIPSNLYAEKIFSEHPTSIWALDDNIDYISLISENDRNIYSWSIDGGSAYSDDDITDEPFPSSSVTKIVGNLFTEESGQIVCISDEVFNLEDLNDYMQNFCIGSYFYSNSSYISGIEIGYRYYDETIGDTVEKIKNFGTSVYGKWVFVSETFPILSEVGSIQIVIKINYISGGTQDDYIFYVNGVTAGQWSEEFNSTSLGLEKILFPEIINVDCDYAVEAKSYGLENIPGYYLIQNNSLVAKNSGIPMVYGSTGTTSISPNNNKPSLIFPGYGFLNNSGKFKEYTVEMWLKINSDSYTKKRIFGPIASDDGLYVEGPFILLKIGNSFESHYVGEWARPMLVHIRYSNNIASLMINGDEVISLNLLTTSLSFPEPYYQNKQQDWLGFYSYEDVFPIEVDCISIYSYPIPSIVAKRRFVYGQGVEIPENINASYSGTSTFIDYSFANYTNNYMYPDLGSWSQASIDNLDVRENCLTSKNYELPEVFFNNKSLEDFYTDSVNLQITNHQYFKLKPNQNWQNTQGYLLFNDVGLVTSSDAFYGIFSVSSFNNDTILLRIDNDSTKEYFSIELIDGKITYLLKYETMENGSLTEQIDTLYQSVPVFIDEKFVVGIYKTIFIDYFGKRIASFFGNLSSAKLYVGGCKELQKTFDGNVYKIGFCSSKNLIPITYLFNPISGIPINFEDVFNNYTEEIDHDAGDEYFEDELDLSGNVQLPSSFWDFLLDGGTPSSFPGDSLISHTASYTLVSVKNFNNFYLTVDIEGTWEDHVPLSYFAQYVTDSRNDSYYDLDLIQFNINYPSPLSFTEDRVNSSWTYNELQLKYSSPELRTYQSLDNNLFTEYLNYDDLKNNSEVNYRYDTDNALVKSYITFQYLESGANAPDSFFINTEMAPKNGVIEPGTSWMQTKYEVVNDMIIYPPKNIDFNKLAIVVQLKFKVNDIIKNKIKIKKLQLASQAFNDIIPNAIGTKFGTSIYPYIKNGLYYNYKDRNPYTIYKDSSPYLYLTRHSGIKVRGQFDPLINRGVLIPINPESSSNYKVMAMQMAIRFDEDIFPYAPTQIFEVESKDSIIKFFMVASNANGKRAKIYAVNTKTGQIEQGIGFYLNGNIVKDPVINIKEWSMIGISFSSLLDFNNYTGSIKINGPLLVNLVSTYKSTNLQEVQNITERPWFRVKSDGGIEFDWQYWDSAYVWQGVLVLSNTSYYGVKPSDIYKSYVGTNKFIIDDTRQFRLNNYEYRIYADALWQSTVQNAI